jgi:hypothetical protein
VIVVKIPRSCDRNRFLEAQYDALRRFRGRLDARLRGSIPAPLFGGEIEGRFVLLQNGMPGTVLPRGLGRRRYPWQRQAFARTLQRVFEWLLDFQSQTRSGNLLLTADLVRREYLRVIDAFRTAYRVDSVEAAYLEDLESSCRALAGTEIPQTAHHGDFYIENLVFSDRGLGVFDWSASKDADLPLWDPFLFVATLHVYEREEGAPEPPHIMLLDHPLRPMLMRFLRDVARHWSIPDDLVRVFFGVFLLKMSLRTVEEYGDNAGRNHLWRKAFGHYVRRQSCWEAA